MPTDVPIDPLGASCEGGEGGEGEGERGQADPWMTCGYIHVRGINGNVTLEKRTKIASCL